MSCSTCPFCRCGHPLTCTCQRCRQENEALIAGEVELLRAEVARLRAQGEQWQALALSTQEALRESRASQGQGQAPASPWRPVTEVEPEQGVKVIGLWQKNGATFDVAMVERRGDSAYDWIEFPDGIDTNEDEQGDVCQPSHWMPLPAAPLPRGPADDASGGRDA